MGRFERAVLVEGRLQAHRVWAPLRPPKNAKNEEKKGKNIPEVVSKVRIEPVPT